MLKSKKRVALVNSRIEPRQHIPINLLILAGCIEDIAEVIVFDPEYDDKELIDIKTFNPDIIGFTSFTQNFYRTKEICNLLKSMLRDDVEYIIGGIHATINPEKTFEELKPNALFVGEGENSLREFILGKPIKSIEGVFLGKDSVKPRELIKNLDNIPLPAYHLMPDLEKYLIPPGTIRGTWQKHGTIALMSSRGCPFSCIFCSSHLMFGRNVRQRSVDNVIREIKLLNTKYGIKSFWFADDTFTLKPNWVKDFCQEIKALNLTWGCQVRADTVENDIIRAMYNSGCKQVDIGVESGSNSTLKQLKKSSTREKIIRAVKILKQNKMRLMATFIIGSPEETREDIYQTIDLLKQIKPNFSVFFYLTPYPGTELYKLCDENNYWLNKEYSGLGSQDSPMISITFTPEELKQIRNELFKVAKWWNLKGYFTFQIIVGLFSITSISGIIAFIKEYIISKNLYDAMFAFIQDYRYKKGKKMENIKIKKK